jgi:hypothetical protein
MSLCTICTDFSTQIAIFIGVKTTSCDVRYCMLSSCLCALSIALEGIGGEGLGKVEGLDVGFATETGLVIRAGVGGMVGEK